MAPTLESLPTEKEHRSRPSKLTALLLIGGIIAFFIYVSMHPMMVQ